MAFWITLARGVLAIALGAAILFWPDKARPLLANFIGGFWIAGSLISIRWGLANERSKLLTIVIGVVGVLAGLAVSGRTLIDRWVPGEGIDLLLGLVAVLTGLLHATGHLQVKKFTTIQRTRSGLILGIFEIILGLIVLFTPWEERGLINYVIIGWAILGGVIILGDALATRREALAQAAQNTEPMPGNGLGVEKEL